MHVGFPAPTTAFALWFLCSAVSPVPAHQLPPQFSPLRLEARSGRLNLFTGELELDGSTRLELPQGWISSEHLRLDWVQLQGEGETIRGFYRFPAGQIDPRELIDPRDVPRGLVLEADRMEMAGGKLQLEGVRVTTCEEPRPHYWLSTRRLTLDTTRQTVSLTRPALSVGGKRWISSPSFTTKVSLGASGEGGPFLLPAVGRNQNDGYFIQWGLQVQALPGQSQVVARLSQESGITGRWFWQQDVGPGPLTLVLSRRENLINDIDSDNQLSRLPEVSWLVEDYSLWDGRVLLDGGLELGQYKEYPHNAQAWRFAFAVNGDAPVGSWQGWRFHLNANGRQSWYSEGDYFRVLGGGAGAERQFGNRAYLRLDYFHWDEWGESPFFFDDLDFRRELRGDLRYRFGRSWVVNWKTRYELDENRFEQSEWLLLKRHHQLEFGVILNTGRFRGISFQGGLVGF